MITTGGRVYMLSNLWLSYYPAIYVTDGTPEGTIQLRPQRMQHEWKAVGSDVYFVEEDYLRWELYRTEGTLETTRIIKRAPSDFDEAQRPKGLTDVNGTLYYYNDLGEVWKSNGTTQGTVRLADLHKVNSITNVDGLAYVLTSNANDDLQVWKTSGSGLVLIKTLPGVRPGLPYYHQPAMSIGGIFYFLTEENTYGHQIWRCDGTTAGTYRMFGPNGFEGETGGRNSRDLVLIKYNDQLYFNDHTALYAARNSTYVKISNMPELMSYGEINGKLVLFTALGNEVHVYISDGSTDGTVFVHSMPLPIYYITSIVIGNFLYYNTLWGPDLWRTDGTICHTQAVDVGAKSPYALGSIGNDLIFGGYTLKAGNEPHVFLNISYHALLDCPAASVQVTVSEERLKTSEEILTAYPNPFTESFTLKVNGKDGDRAEIAVYTGSGMPVEKIKNLRVNDETIKIGASWQRGSYIVKVITGNNKIETYHVIKD
jgi:ELWxxDGT repeat protein